MNTDFNIDSEKVRILLKYVLRANKKILERKHTLKKLHQEITQLKKITSKSVHGKIAKLEKNILDTLKEGGFIQECEEETYQEPVIIEPQEQTPNEDLHIKTREELLKEVEAHAVKKEQITTKQRTSSLKNIEASLKRLEQIRKKFKAKGAVEKDKLKDIVLRIKLLKQKIISFKSFKKRRISKKKKPTK